jgi:hypothetical protein
MSDELKPRDHAEAVALFRAQVLGPLLCRDQLHHGERLAALRELSETPVRPPDATISRTYAVCTLERWLYAYRRGGLRALEPRRRSDRGLARALTDEQRQLVLAIRAEHPRASAAPTVLHESAGGRLRDIDRIASDALKRAARRKLRKVDRQLLESVLDTEELD